MTQEKFTECHFTTVCSQGWPGTTISVLSRVIVRRSPGTDTNPTRLADRFYWSGMSDDVKDWLGQCVTCIKWKSPVGRHHPLGNIPTGHRWDRIAMDILDVCDPTLEGFRYILVIADYFSKWTEAFPMKNKCADTVADIYYGLECHWLYTAIRAENSRMDL